MLEKGIVETHPLARFSSRYRRLAIGSGARSAGTLARVGGKRHVHPALGSPELQGVRGAGSSEGRHLTGCKTPSLVPVVSVGAARSRLAHLRGPPHGPLFSGTPPAWFGIRILLLDPTSELRGDRHLRFVVHTGTRLVWMRGRKGPEMCLEQEARYSFPPDSASTPS